MSLSINDKKEKRKSFNSDNAEMSELFDMKLEVQDSIKKYISAKVNYQLKQFENKIADDLMAKWLDELDHVTTKLIQKIEKTEK